MAVYTKTIYYSDYEKKVKRADVEREVELQTVASAYGFSPSIIGVSYELDHAVIKMEDLQEMCLADKYGEEFSSLSPQIIIQIRLILEALFENEGIEYIDITPYNFIEKNNKVYIIDFGHAYYVNPAKKTNWFLKDFLEGTNSWNPDFK